MTKNKIVKIERAFYRKTFWNELPMYECTECTFTTFDLAEIEAHVKQYQPQPISQVSAPKETDRFGNEIGG